MEKTYIPKEEEINREWFVIDANQQILGRLASKIANVLIGKNKPNFTPGVQTGDGVIVLNAKNIRVTGKKMNVKMYHSHSGYPGGLKSITLRDQLEKHPDRVIRAAVWGMLPHNKRGKRILKMLKVYPGAEHPHVGQQPKPLQ